MYVAQSSTQSCDSDPPIFITLAHGPWCVLNGRPKWMFSSRGERRRGGQMGVVIREGAGGEFEKKITS